VNGGAAAIGHPLGASGARIMTTLVNALEQRGGRYGLRRMCEGGGMANATIIERLGHLRREKASGRGLAGAESIEHGVQCLHSLVACRPLIGRIGDK
jgi:Thiolase, C-terminal domain